MIVVIVVLAVVVIIASITSVVVATRHRHRRLTSSGGSTPSDLDRPPYSTGTLTGSIEVGEGSERAAGERLDASLLGKGVHPMGSQDVQVASQDEQVGSQDVQVAKEHLAIDEEDTEAVQAPYEEAVAITTPSGASPSSEAQQLSPEEAVAVTPRLRDRLGKVRQLMSGYVASLRTRSAISEESWEELEEALIRADVGVATTQSLLAKVRSRAAEGSSAASSIVLDILKDELVSVLSNVSNSSENASKESSSSVPGSTSLKIEQGVTNIWLFVGVNGVGKTTTIGKLALKEKAAGRRVVLAAADTFRAAAVDQLAQWAQMVGVDIVKGTEGGDPGAVVYDAVEKAVARGYELVLADTAGRLHTKVNLMEELKKIKRVAERSAGSLSEVLLVIDATTGQNGLTQARQFAEAVGVTGVVLTKLDGTAKGGIVVAIESELGVPVKLVGIGESPSDLVEFDPKEFVEALF